MIVTADSVTKRILEIAIPPGATQSQINQLYRAAYDLGQKGIDVIIHVIK